MKKISIIIAILALMSPISKLDAISQPTPVENTQVLCSNGLDDDENGLGDYQDPACSAFIPAPTPVENTQVLCSNGLDDDENGLGDYQDPACSAFIPAPTPVENTQVLCSNGLDDDENGLGDYQDPACSAFIPAPVPPTPPTPTTPVVVSTGGSGSSSGGFVSTVQTGSTPSVGTPISAVGVNNVDGINMNCKQLFKTSMRVGKTPNKGEALRLQAFLNKNLGLKLALTGTYDAATSAAVSQFQLKFKDSVLTPWGLTTPTGIFHQTTRRQVNLLVCPAAPTDMPTLVPMK